MHSSLVSSKLECQAICKTRHANVSGRSAPASSEPPVEPKKVPPGAVSKCAAATNLPTSGSDSTCTTHNPWCAWRYEQLVR